MTATTSTIDDVRAAVAAARAAGKRVALVPTMGALHAGHLALVERARELADLVVVSVFVNPMQFGPKEDFARYPRDLAADTALLDAAGADVLFAPDAGELLPEGRTQVRVAAGPAGDVLEGRIRPGHFDGVLTIVLKLLHVVGPDVVVFGQKDAQQVFLVQRMVRDLDVPVAVDVVETVREDDGLALSSRNRYLQGGERRLARAVPAALDAAESFADRDVDAMVAAAQGALAGEDGADLEYLAVVDPASFRPVDDGYRGRALVLVAARVGGTRLIDNRFVHLG
ncbi:pantoate--beta-alanine ligase [Amnibacterium kyonggiense]|uniref:Pantothenate synthetase n=1 Tax=Amnibacterium kyonggiense TaxID=595671 RepID=A0A4R7FQJ7_9MICO|nr:pantoate--beta-alanine ligase [Amnibacterium kyonggiense]TDS80023.1 pantothenate synthetase [Amnibacterium kyonggiense]